MFISYIKQAGNSDRLVSDVAGKILVKNWGIMMLGILWICLKIRFQWCNIVPIEIAILEVYPIFRQTHIFECQLYLVVA